MTKGRRELGAEGERLAAEYLQARGFRVLERNYRTPLGEIDLIARKGTALHFIEVKTRQSLAGGDPFEQLTPRKQRQIVRTALAYCSQHRLRDPEIHFDAVGIDHSSALPTIDHLIDAFDVSEALPY